MSRNLKKIEERRANLFNQLEELKASFKEEPTLELGKAIQNLRHQLSRLPKPATKLQLFLS